MTQRTLLVLILAFIALGGLLSVQDMLGQDPTNSLEERVAKLEKELVDLKEYSGLQTQVLKENEIRLALVESWMQQLPTALKRLQQGLDQTVAKGFTKAGANIPARVELIQSLRNLAAALERGVPSAQKR